jgi:hypothetical protein
VEILSSRGLSAGSSQGTSYVAVLRFKHQKKAANKTALSNLSSYHFLPGAHSPPQLSPACVALIIVPVAFVSNKVEHFAPFCPPIGNAGLEARLKLVDVEEKKLPPEIVV